MFHKTRTRPSSLGKRILLLVMLLSLLGTCFHRVLLRSAAKTLMVNEQHHGADHLLIMGGDKSYQVAVDMLKRDEASSVLVFESSGGNLVKFGILPPPHEVAHRELLKHGIAADDITRVVSDPERRYFGSLRLWMRRNPTSHVCLFTDSFSSKRTRQLVNLAMSRALSHRVTIVGLPDRRFDENNWWKSRVGIKTFVTTMLGLIHTNLMGLPQRSKSSSWDPDEYELQLARTKSETS